MSKVISVNAVNYPIIIQCIGIEYNINDYLLYLDARNYKRKALIKHDEDGVPYVVIKGDKYYLQDFLKV